jgi:hypothetical protein
MLSSFEGRFGHRKMRRVGRADVDRFDPRIRQRSAKRSFIAPADRNGFHRSETPHSLGVYPAHEPAAYDCGLYTHHAAPGFAPGTI